MTLGCRTIFKMWISRVTLSTSLWSFILSFSKILMATFSPVMRWVPNLTLPKVPYPRERPIIVDYDWFGYILLTYYIMSNCPIGIRVIVVVVTSCSRFSCWNFCRSLLNSLRIPTISNLLSRGSSGFFNYLWFSSLLTGSSYFLFWHWS